MRIRLTVISFALAMAAAVFLLVWPVYSGFEGERPTHAPLLHVNGPWVIVPVTFPVAVALMPLVVRKQEARIIATVAIGAFVLISGSCGIFDSMTSSTGLPDAAAFEAAIRRKWREGERAGANCVDVCSGAVHRQLGGYPGPNHRMPDCCQVMRRLMVSADSIVSAPPKGNGATLVIRYRLPR